MSLSTLDDLLSLWEEQKESGTPVTPEELCADQPELLDKVRWYIKALEAVDSHFGLTEGKNGSTGEVRNRAEIVPEDLVQVATEYQIERLHACGGLGQVYVATDSVLKRKVAIKFPRWEQLSTEQSARFEREARITGRLDHPGIIPIHALKSDARGRPFYVMRFVDGQTLQEKIEHFHSGLQNFKSRAIFESVAFRQLLQDFVTVCNIVAYAHRQGVIHRDIKPGNIILGPFGEVVLLDWGLARVHGESDGDAVESNSTAGIPGKEEVDAFETREGQTLGTPAFASPEQLFGRTNDMDARSDVYSLGATLFVMLTGSSVTGTTAFHEHLNRLKQGVQRSAHEENKSVPRALEAICRCAMAIEPKNRYGSALMLANDVQRYLAGESVSVKADSVLVRSGRLIRRRPGIAAASLATVLVATIATATVSLILGQKNQQLNSNNEQLKIAVTSSNTANVQTMEALRTLVDDIVTQKFSEQTGLSDADRRFLQAIMQQYESFATLKGNNVESKAIRAEGRYQCGILLTQLGDEKQARMSLEAAVELYQQLVNETDQVEFRKQLAAALVELGFSMKFHGELQTAEVTANRGIELLIPVLSDNITKDNVPVLEVYGSLYQLKGELQISSHRKNDALVSYSAAKEVFERLHDADPESSHTMARLASTYRALSDVCGQAGDIGGQEQFSQLALKLYRKLMERFPEDRNYCRGFAWACYDRSYSHEFFERTKAALDEMTEAEVVAARLSAKFPLSDEFRGLLASMRIRRASIHIRAGHYFLAEADLQNAIAMFEEVLDQSTDGALSYRQLVKALRMLGLLRDSYGQYVEAEAAFRLAVKHTAVFAADYPESAAQAREIDALPNELATVIGHQGKILEAIEEIKTWVTVAEESPEELFAPIRQLRLLQARCGLSQLYIEGSQQAEAQEQVEMAALMTKALEETHASDFDLMEHLADVHRQIAHLCRMLNCKDQAEVHASRHLQIVEQLAASMPGQSYYLVKHVQALTERAEEFVDRNDIANVQSQFEAAEIIALQAIGKFPNDLSVRRAREEILWAQGHFYFDKNDFTAALQRFDQAIRLKSDAKHRPIRAWCLALLKSDRAAQEICEIAGKHSVDGPELVDFLCACGAALVNSESAADGLKIEAAAITVLQSSVEAGCVLRPAALLKLNSRPELAFLQNRSDTRLLLEKLYPQPSAP